MRDLILGEIRRLAAQNGGKPPGKGTFARATGITEGKWNGVIWARWSDALVEAGFAPNELQGRLGDAGVLLRVVELSREIGRFPTRAEMKLRRCADSAFPSAGAIAHRFPTNADLIEAFRKLIAAGGNDRLAADAAQ